MTVDVDVDVDVGVDVDVAVGVTVVMCSVMMRPTDDRVEWGVNCNTSHTPHATLHAYQQQAAQTAVVVNTAAMQIMYRNPYMHASLWT